MQSSRLYFILLAWTAFSVLCASVTSLYAQEQNSQTWGRVSFQSSYENKLGHEPTGNGDVTASPDDSLHLSPAFHLGINNSFQDRFKLNGLFAFQQRYLNAGEALFPNPFEARGPYPETIVEQVFALNLALHVAFTKSLSAGLSAERSWSHVRWDGSGWEPIDRVQVAPWFGVLWNPEHQSYVSSLFVRRVHPADPELSYKMDINPFDDLSVRFSHLYTYSSTLRFAGEVHREKRLFEDFWMDSIDQGLGLGAEWYFLKSLSASTQLGLSHRKFLLPWKRVGTCFQKLKGDVDDYYQRDPRDCHRWEWDSFWEMGLNWDIFPQFRVSGIINYSGIQASEPEFASLRKRYLVLVSWQTQSTLLSDPLRSFFPWAYRGEAYD